jgi:ABC-2 type transport system permease protein
VPATGLLRAEWTRLRTVPSTWWCLAVYAAVVLALAWLGAAITDSAPQPGIAVAAAFTSFGVGQVVLVVLGVLVGAGEFVTGMAVATFGAVPRRTAVLLARTTVAAVVAAVPTAVLALAAVLAARSMTEVPGGTGLTDPAVLRPIVLQALVSGLLVALAVSLGVLLRSIAGGVGLCLALVLVAPPVLAADDRRLTELLAQALPAMRVGEDAFLAGVSGWVAGTAVLAAWAAGAWLLAAVVLARREV